MTDTRQLSSKRRLIICVAGVSAAHALVLSGAPLPFGPMATAQAPSMSFETRLIEAPVAEPDVRSTPEQRQPEPDRPPTPKTAAQPDERVASTPQADTNSGAQAQAVDDAPSATNIASHDTTAAAPPPPDSDTPQASMVRQQGADLPVPSEAGLVAGALGQAQPSLFVGQHFTLTPSATVPVPVPPIPAAIAQQLAPATLLASAAPTGPAGGTDGGGRLEAPSVGTTLGPARVPTSQRLRYEVKGEARRFPYSANAELLWKTQSGHYDARLEISALLFPSRIQTSTGLVNAQGLAPTRFSDKLRTEVAAHFERDKGKVTYSANTPDTPLAPGMQDRLSVLLQLGSLIAADPGRYAQGSRVVLPTVGPRDADTWIFTVGPDEALDTPHGRHTARRLSRVPQREHDLRVDLWVSSDIQYLPLQLRMTQSNGDFVLMQLKAAVAP